MAFDVIYFFIKLIYRFVISVIAGAFGSIVLLAFIGMSALVVCLPLATYQEKKGIKKSIFISCCHKIIDDDNFQEKIMKVFAIIGVVISIFIYSVHLCGIPDTQIPLVIEDLAEELQRFYD